jgi:putative membrane protein
MPQAKHSGWVLGAGVLVLALLWLGPLPEMSKTAFSAHMLLHLGVVSLAAPLIATGLLGLGIADKVFPPLLVSAMLATAFDLVVVWGWHSPPLHEAAARHTGAFALQQASFLVAGLSVWATSFSTRNRERGGLGVLAMFMTFTHMTMLGILLALSPELIYAPDLCLGAFGFAQLDDQRFGGVLMASVGGLPYLLGGLFLVYRMLGEPREQ